MNRSLSWRIVAGGALVMLTAALVSRTEAADIKDPRIRASVAGAADYLRKQLNSNTTAGHAPTGQKSIAAYALLKAGDRPTNPMIQKVVSDVVQRTANGNYSPGADGHYGIYTAGTELMLLEAADPERYRKPMEVIVKYILGHQDSSGAWDYTDGFRGGDTSQVQYALLGLWAAERAGIKVPLEVWDKCAGWLIQTQYRNGGFAYHPRGDIEPQKVVTHSMTVAAVSCLLICKEYLYPDDVDTRQKSDENLKFGVLEEVDLDTVEQPGQTAAPTNQNYQPTTSLSALRGSVDRGLGWFAGQYRIRDVGIWGMYYLYTVERMSALADADTFAGHDWYREGSEFLLNSQSKEGSWNDNSTAVPATAFGILFLTRATGQLLGRVVDDALGSGLLAGGRGLPTDLSQAIVHNGKVEQEKNLGPIDQLLAELEKIDSVDFAETQQAIVQQVQLGDREELIKQKDRLVKLAKHPHAEIRRTALWAIGRTEDVALAKILYEALDDNNIDVMVEARNAFCILSRKPLGFGLPESPFEGLPEDATEKQRQEAVDAWRKQLKAKWGEWYYKFRPYTQRDDLSESLFEAQKK